MSWRVYGDPFVTSDFSGTVPTKWVSVKVSSNLLVKAVRTWVIAYNNPTYTSLQMKIYSAKSSAPRQLLYSSAVLSKASFQTLSNAAKEAYFDFASPPPLRLGDVYYFALWVNGYSGDASSHLSWMQSIPDPVTTSGFTLTFSNLTLAPYKLSLIAGAM